MILVSQKAQIVIAILLVGVVLIQSKGKGLSSTVGGSVGFYRSRRGLEKIVFIVTILLGILLIVNSLLLIIFG